jgi:hypothetical protein
MLFTHEDTRPLLHFCNVQNQAEINSIVHAIP